MGVCSYGGDFEEGLVDAAVEFGGAFEVARGMDAFGDAHAVLVQQHATLLALATAAQIALERHQDDLDPGTVVSNLGHPLTISHQTGCKVRTLVKGQSGWRGLGGVTYAGFDVFQTHRVIRSKAEHDDVGVCIRQCAQLVEFLLSCRVPERHFDRMPCARRLDRMHVVLEYRRLTTGSQRQHMHR